MLNKYFHSILFIILMMGASTSLGSSQELYANIITTPVWNGSNSLTIIVKVTNNNLEVNSMVNGSYLIQAVNAVLESDTIDIRKGVGSLTTIVDASTDFLISIEGFSGEKFIQLDEQVPIKEIGGELSTSDTWENDTIYHIVDNLIIPENVSLQIEAGSQIFLGEKVNITILGHLEINAVNDSLVLFGSIDGSKPWGGLYLSNVADTISFNHCIFNNGGDNEDFIFGHSESQPIVFFENSVALLTNCYFIDNPGKAIGGLNSIIKIDQCLTSRCDTGGEYHHCLVNISDSWYTEIPGEEYSPDIDDNDALYFYEVYPDLQEPTTIKNCFFVNGMDDGIDHNGAIISIENCWIENFVHEGIAASNYNELIVYNTLIKNCEQGIEAGYGSPFLKVDHCVFVENVVGIRFGDSYNWGCEGQMEITNSITFNNDDNIKNYDLLTQGPVEGAINISYSLTNDIDYNNYPGCLEGAPDFDNNYFLLPGSIGIGLANDNGNLGLINPTIGINYTNNNLQFAVFPNPFTKNFLISVYPQTKHSIQINIFDSKGVLMYKKSFHETYPVNNRIMIDDTNFKPGIYFLLILSNEKILGTKKLIKVD